MSEVTLSVLLLTYVIDDKQEYSPPPSVRTVHKKRRTSVQGRNSFTTPKYTQKTRNAVNSRSRRDSSYSYAPKQNRYSLALQESLKFGMYSLLFTTPTEVHLPLIRSALTVYKEAGSVLDWDLLYQLRIQSRYRRNLTVSFADRKLQQRIENLQVLKEAFTFNLIDVDQYAAKQKEFLLAFSFKPTF